MNAEASLIVVLLVLSLVLGGCCVAAILTLRGLVEKFAGQAAAHNTVSLEVRQQEIEAKRLMLEEGRLQQAEAAARAQRDMRAFDVNRHVKGNGMNVTMGVDKTMPSAIG